MAPQPGSSTEVHLLTTFLFRGHNTSTRLPNVGGLCTRWIRGRDAVWIAPGSSRPTPASAHTACKDASNGARGHHIVHVVVVVVDSSLLLRPVLRLIRPSNAGALGLWLLPFWWCMSPVGRVIDLAHFTHVRKTARSGSLALPPCPPGPTCATCQRSTVQCPSARRFHSRFLVCFDSTSVSRRLSFFFFLSGQSWVLLSPYKRTLASFPPRQLCLSHLHSA